MVRSLGMVAGMAVLVLGLSGSVTIGQQVGEDVVPVVATTQGDAEFPVRAELLRRIAVDEELQRRAEAEHADLETMVELESNLAHLYQDVGMYPKAERELRREIARLRGGPQNELADAIGQMALLHMQTGDLRQSERDELETLQIRESQDDSMGTALAWSDLADIYVKQRHYKQGLDYAGKAMTVLGDDPKVGVDNRIVVRQTLALALCGLKQCGQAIQLLTDALQLQKISYGADSVMVAAGKYLLGYAYWQNGNMDEAADLMGQGVAKMKADLGWGNAIYLNTANQYVLFLRQRGQVRQAAEAEREIKLANAVVDARTLATSQSAFLAGAK